MDLQDWQRVLQEHFSKLRARRSVEIGDEPLFALEHELGEDDVDAVALAVRAHILHRPPSWEHRLPWIVYASEFGYEYSGDEYWQTFEEETPGWQERGNRHWVRRCFIDFHERFGGAKPTGPWARHFSIICWPITHAILPRDLQLQLARLLFEVRHVLSSRALETPRRLGELLAARSWGGSSRFRQLTQEPLLLGQIASALLLQDEPSASSLILPTTLRRIGEDLDRERRARTWMRGARKSARQQVRFARIIDMGGQRGPTTEQEDGKRNAPPTNHVLEPRLVLRPTGEETWDVLLELPDFSPALARFPELKEPLVESRSYLEGSGKPLARGRLLYGPQRIRLRRWPQAGSPLLRFERSDLGFDHFLSLGCLLRPGPTWLFKVASDDLAHELRAAVVRAGQKYILLCEDRPPKNAPPFVNPVRVCCERVHAVLLDLPPAITPQLGEVLAELGIRQAGTLRVWPAGLTPANWDGEGNAEWLSTETPRVGACVDHSVDVFTFQLGAETLEVAPSRTGAPVFVELAGLAVGRHTLRVSATSSDGLADHRPTNLEIRIREPRVWRPGCATQGALFVVLDPSTPTLEQLWENEVQVEVHGPPDHQVICTVQLYRKGDTKPSCEKELPPLRLPVTANDWRVRIDMHFRKDRDVQNAYDRAHRCEVRLRAGELGAFRLTAEREFSPLRWAVYRTQRAYLLRMLDDSGVDEDPRVERYGFDTPDVAEPLDPTPFCKDKGREVRAGLHVARCGDHQCAVVIFPERYPLAALRVEPRLRSRKRTPSNVMDLIGLVDLWSKAHLTGGLSGLSMRKRILECMMQKVFGLIGGNRWEKAEQDLPRSRGDETVRIALEAVSSKRDEGKIVTVIADDVHELAEMPPRERVARLAELGRRILGLAADRGSGEGKTGDGPERLEWFSEFALRLASAPATVVDWAGENVDAAIARLVEVPALARAARLMVFLTAGSRSSAEYESGILYKGWDWT